MLIDKVCSYVSDKLSLSTGNDCIYFSSSVIFGLIDVSNCSIKRLLNISYESKIISREFIISLVVLNCIDSSLSTKCQVCNLVSLEFVEKFSSLLSENVLFFLTLVSGNITVVGIKVVFLSRKECINCRDCSSEFLSGRIRRIGPSVIEFLNECRNRLHSYRVNGLIAGLIRSCDNVCLVIVIGDESGNLTVGNSIVNCGCCTVIYGNLINYGCISCSNRTCAARCLGSIRSNCCIVCRHSRNYKVKYMSVGRDNSCISCCIRNLYVEDSVLCICLQNTEG